ncbi:MAG: hypothetical protein LPK85_05300, partial [Gammaproteobacteria bacterium]|nr:hypothetical protein [Gammaproteobacteria bacterium]
GDRQRRATEFFASEIAEQEKRLSKESQSSPADMRAAVDNANAALESTYTALAAWSAYPDFINPLANWLHGWHLMVAPQTSGDWSRAAELFGSVVGMLPENPVAAADQDWANRLADGAVRPEALPPTVWVLVERGLAPLKVEERVEFPVPIYHGEGTTFWTGFAIPALQPRPAPWPIRVSLGANISGTYLLADMDAVIGQEFAKRLPGIVTRAVIGSVAKTMLQYRMRRNAGELAGILALVYQVATTSADTRMWTSLPKQIELAKLERTADTLVLQGGGQDIRIPLPQAHWTLVWVRWPDSLAAPRYQVLVAPTGP